jgi:hypothetical protein
MFFPAARIGDPLTHDSVTPCGAIAPGPCGQLGNVVIEFLPAAHVTDLAVCTGVIATGIVHPPIPGPQPPIITGAFQTLIHFLPAARWAPSGDVAACGTFLGMPTASATRTTFIGK